MLGSWCEAVRCMIKSTGTRKYQPLDLAPCACPDDSKLGSESPKSVPYASCSFHQCPTYRHEAKPVPAENKKYWVGWQQWKAEVIQNIALKNRRIYELTNKHLIQRYTTVPLMHTSLK